MRKIILSLFFIGFIATACNSQNFNQSATQPAIQNMPFQGSTLQSLMPSSMPGAPSGAPSGSSAECMDRTWSFSKHKQGTCSHHGGVYLDWGFQDQ